MIIEISIAVIAVAFVILVIYLIVLTNALRRTLHQVDHTLVDVRKQLDEIGGQAKKVVEHTNQVSFDVKRKMESLDSVFHAIGQVGDILEHKTLAIKKDLSFERENKHTHVNFSEDHHKVSTYEFNKFADILELIGAGLRVWQKIKKRR